MVAAGTEWYWRVRRYEDHRRSPQVTAFWATPAEAARRLVELLAAGAGEPTPETVAAVAAEAAPVRPRTVREALGFWVGHQAARHEAKDIADASLAAARANARMIAEAIGDRPVTDAGGPLVADLALKLGATYSPQTVKIGVTTAIRALTWCMENNLVPEQQIRRPRTRRPEAHPKTVARWSDFWAAEAATPIGPTWVMLCMVGLTGCRPMEAARARWGDLTLSDAPDVPSTLRIGAHADMRNDGGKHPRTLALHPELATRLRRWRDVVGARPARETLTGQSPHTAKSWHLRVGWQALGLPASMSGYDFRRLMSLTLMAQGVDPKVYEGLMGHSYALGLAIYRQHDQASQQAALVGAVDVIQQADPAEPPAGRFGAPSGP